MSDYVYLQKKFFDDYIDRAKQRYLNRKKPFASAVLAFRDKKAWVIPLDFETMREKHRFMLMMAGAFAAQDVERFGFLVDTWCVAVKIDNTEGKTDEELLEEAQKKRAGLPDDFSKEDFPERTECILWGMYGGSGLEFAYGQDHDSREHRLTSKARKCTDHDRFVVDAFRNLIPLSREADFKAAGVTKKELWHYMSAYMECKGIPVTEVDLKN
jgi:hypothetical protein